MKIKTPVALMMFKRHDTVPRIIDRIATARPPRIYLLSDHGRDAEEKKLVEKTRLAAERAITWECDIVKLYHHENVGVLGNIALGATRVLQREPRCIFLEDDNLPAPTFFTYCETMLDRFQDNDKILWICGTNYLSPRIMDRLQRKNKIAPRDAFFTRLMLPCGWASWSEKFLRHYDPFMKNYSDEWLDAYRFPACYHPAHARACKQAIRRTARQLAAGDTRRVSWDYQMLHALLLDNLLGIMPRYNQITNIGDDGAGTHSGKNVNRFPRVILDCVMARRFLNLPAYPAGDTLSTPADIEITPALEHLESCRMILPAWLRIPSRTCGKIKKIILTSKNTTS